MVYSTPGLPVPHHLPKFAQIHVHCIGDVIQPSHPLTLFSSSALNLSQHWGLLQWVGWSVTKILDVSASVLPMSIQGWFPLRLTGLISLLPKGLSGVFFSTTVRRHLSPLALCLLYGPAFTAVHGLWENHILENADLFRNNVSTFQHTT